MAESYLTDEQPPNSTHPDLAEYLTRMFEEIRIDLQNSDHFPPITALPDRPIESKLYYFNTVISGTVITIPGFYHFLNGDWYYIPDICTNGAWEDNTGQIEPGNSVGGAPTYMFPNGGNYQVPIMNGTPQRRWQIPFHIKHDVKQGSTIYPHIHWTPDGTWGAGQTATFLITWQAAAGHQQAVFSAPVSITITHAPTGGPFPAWEHMIAEGTNPSTQGIPMPEIDSLILLTVELQSKTGGSPNVGGLFVDLHYERERLSSKSKAPDFYT